MKKFLLYTLLLLAAFIAALPSLLSTSWVRERILAAINMPDQLNFDSISLSWFTGQEIHGLVVKAPAEYGPLTLKAPSISLEMTLWEFAKAQTVVGSYIFEADELVFERPGVAPLKLTDNTLKVDIHALSKQQISLTSDLKGFLDRGILHVISKYDSAIPSYSAVMEGKTLPFLTLLDFLAVGPKERQKAAALIGESTDFEASFSSLSLGKTALNFHYKGDHSEGNLKGVLENGALTLEQNATLSLTVNPLLSREILKAFNPLLVSALRGERPISLTIHAAGTHIPLFPLNAAETIIPLTVLDPGKIILKDEGLASTLLGLFGGKATNKEISAWFTPQIMHIQQGVVQVERMDLLLADQFHLALWGVVDIPQDKLRLFLGISTEILTRVFSLQNPRQMMTVAISGSLSQPTVDSKRLLLDIGTMALLPEAPGSAVIPPPTTQPFPWGAEVAPQQEQAVSPTQTIQDVGKQLFKELLKRK